MKSSLRNMVIVLTSITLLASLAVGGVHMATKDTIAGANDKKFKNALVKILPDFDTLKEEVIIQPTDGSLPLKIYEATLDGQTTGYAVETSALGFTQDIILLAGFNSEGEINKIAVMSHAETPGLGSKITDSNDKFVVQFQGKNPKDFNLMIKKDGGDVDIITASTITSRAYTLAIKKAYNAIEDIKKK